MAVQSILAVNYFRLDNYLRGSQVRFFKILLIFLSKLLIVFEFCWSVLKGTDIPWFEK